MIDNPRFPHTCKVYRITGESPFSDGKVKIMYEGLCNKYGVMNMIAREKKGALNSNYAVDIPKLVKGVKAGDLIDVEDYSCNVNGCVVSDCYATSMGTTIYFNMPKN